MKKMAKRILSAFLSVLMVITMLPTFAISALAATDDTVNINLTASYVGITAADSNRYSASGQTATLNIVNDREDSNFSIGYVNIDISAYSGRTFKSFPLTFGKGADADGDCQGLKFWYTGNTNGDGLTTNGRVANNSNVTGTTNGHLGKAITYYGLTEIASFTKDQFNAGTMEIDVAAAANATLARGGTRLVIMVTQAQSGGQGSNGGWTDTKVTFNKAQTCDAVLKGDTTVSGRLSNNGTGLPISGSESRWGSNQFNIVNDQQANNTDAGIIRFDISSLNNTTVKNATLNYKVDSWSADTVTTGLTFYYSTSINNESTYINNGEKQGTNWNCGSGTTANNSFATGLGFSTSNTLGVVSKGSATSNTTMDIKSALQKAVDAGATKFFIIIMQSTAGGSGSNSGWSDTKVTPANFTIDYTATEKEKTRTDVANAKKDLTAKTFSNYPYSGTMKSTQDGSYSESTLKGGDEMKQVLYSYGVSGSAAYKDCGDSNYSQLGWQYGDATLLWDGVNEMAVPVNYFHHRTKGIWPNNGNGNPQSVYVVGGTAHDDTAVSLKHIWHGTTTSAVYQTGTTNGLNIVKSNTESSPGPAKPDNNNNQYYSNTLYVDGSKLSFGTNRRITLQFHWWSYYYGNGGNKNRDFYSDSGNTKVDHASIRVINYAPIAEAIRKGKEIYNTVSNDEYSYCPTDLYNFYTALKKLMDFNPNNYFAYNNNGYAACCEAMEALDPYISPAKTPLTKSHTVYTHSYTNGVAKAAQKHTIHCNDCGEDIEEDCTWNAGDVTTQPTCTATGVKTYTCTKCSGQTTETIAANGHTWGAWNGDFSSTKHTRQCSVCKEWDEYILCSEHYLSIPAVPATCTSTGLTEGKRCSVCGKIRVAQTEVPMKAHTYGEWSEYDRDDDWIYQERYCSACNDRQTQKIENTNVFYTVIYMDEKGVELYRESIQKGSNPNGFGEAPDGIDVDGNPGHYHYRWSLTVGGNTSYYNSVTIKDVAVTSDLTFVADLNKVPHSFGEWETFKAETCTTDRIERRYCTVEDDLNCTVYEERTVADTARGHNYGAWVKDTATTHKRVCSRNAEHFETADCQFDSVTYPATCTTREYTVYTCHDGCGNTYTEYSEVAPSHAVKYVYTNLNNITVTGDPDHPVALTDCTQNGTYDRYTVCTRGADCTGTGEIMENEGRIIKLDENNPVNSENASHDFHTFNDNNASNGVLGTHTTACSRCYTSTTEPHNVTLAKVGNTITATCANCDFSKVLHTTNTTFRITQGNMFDTDAFINSVGTGVFDTNRGSAASRKTDDTITVIGNGDNYTDHGDMSKVYRIPVVAGHTYQLEFDAETPYGDVMAFYPNNDNTGYDSNYLAMRITGTTVGTNVLEFTVPDGKSEVYFRFGTNSTAQAVYQVYSNISFHEKNDANYQVLATNVAADTNIYTALGKTYGSAEFCSYYYNNMVEKTVGGVNNERLVSASSTISTNTNVKPHVEHTLYKEFRNGTVAHYYCTVCGYHTDKVVSVPQMIYHESFDNAAVDSTRLQSSQGDGTLANANTGSIVEYAGLNDKGTRSTNVRHNVLKLNANGTKPGNYLKLDTNPLANPAVAETAKQDGITISFWRHMEKNGAAANLDTDKNDPTGYPWRNAISFEEDGNAGNRYYIEVNGVQSRCAQDGAHYTDLVPYYNDNTTKGTPNYTGDWVHIAVTIDPNDKVNGGTLYINGVPREYDLTRTKGVGKYELSDTNNPGDIAADVLNFLTQSNTGFYFNNGAPWEGNDFDMFYDDVRIYTGVMNQLEINQMYGADDSDTPSKESITHDPTNVTVYTLKAGTYTAVNGSGETYVAEAGKTVGEEFINYYGVDVATQVSNIEYYSFGTGMVIEKSSNGYEWEMVGDSRGRFAYQNEDLFGGKYTDVLSEPLNYAKQGASGGGYLLWAPHVMYNLTLNKWVIYESTSSWGSQFSTIFYCTSDTVYKDYAYQGMIHKTNSSSKCNAIDSDVYYGHDENGIIDKSTLYLAYGSYCWNGSNIAIWGRELTATGENKPGVDSTWSESVDYPCIKADGTSSEGIYVYYYNGYYYMYTTYGSNDYNYTEVYFRSENPNGPFTRYDGVSATADTGMYFMGSYKMPCEKYTYWANGHNSVYTVYNNAGEPMLVNAAHSRALVDGGIQSDEGQIITNQTDIRGNLMISNMLGQTKNGWMVMFPLQYKGTDTTKLSLTGSDIIGKYYYVDNIKSTSNGVAETKTLEIRACNGTTATIQFDDDSIQTFDLVQADGKTYMVGKDNSIEGLFAKQGDTVEFSYFNTSTLQFTMGYRYEVSSELSHSFTNYNYNEDAPSCTENGTETAECDNGCGETDTKEAIGTAPGHTLDAHYVKATCTEDAYYTSACTKCDYVDSVHHAFVDYDLPSDASQLVSWHVNGHANNITDYLDNKTKDYNFVVDCGAPINHLEITFTTHIHDAYGRTFEHFKFFDGEGNEIYAQTKRDEKFNVEHTISIPGNKYTLQGRYMKNNDQLIITGIKVCLGLPDGWTEADLKANAEDESRHNYQPQVSNVGDFYTWIDVCQYDNNHTKDIKKIDFSAYNEAVAQAGVNTAATDKYTEDSIKALQAVLDDNAVTDADKAANSTLTATRLEAMTAAITTANKLVDEGGVLEYKENTLTFNVIDYTDGDSDPIGSCTYNLQYGERQVLDIMTAHGDTGSTIPDLSTGYSVYKWTRYDKGDVNKLGSTSTSITAIMPANDVVYYVYVKNSEKSVESTTYKVQMLTNYKKVADVNYVAKGNHTLSLGKSDYELMIGESKITAQQYPFYAIEGYKIGDDVYYVDDLTGKSVEINEDTVIEPIYEVKVQYIIKLDGDVDTADDNAVLTDNGIRYVNGSWDTVVKLTSENADSNTKWYVAPINASGERTAEPMLAGYGEVYSFRVSQSCEISYVNNSEKALPTIAIERVTYNTPREKTITAVAKYALPVGYTFKKAGVIMKTSTAGSISNVVSDYTPAYTTGKGKFAVENLLTQTDQFIINVYASKTYSNLDVGAIAYLEYTYEEDGVTKEGVAYSTSVATYHYVA